MGTGTAPTKRKGNGQFRVLLVIWIIMFGLGVFAGVTLTKKAFGMPAWVQRVLGLEPIITGIQRKTTPATQTPAIPPQTSDVKQTEKIPDKPPTQPTEIGNPAPNQTRDPFSENNNTSEPSNSAVSPQSAAPVRMSAEDMGRKVRTYHDLLNQVKSAEKSFKTSRKAVTDNKNNPEASQAALAQQQTDIEEIAGALKQAQAIWEELRSDPQFEERYTEDTLALTLYPVPQFLKDTKADTLRFLKKRT